MRVSQICRNTKTCQPGVLIYQHYLGATVVPTSLPRKCRPERHVGESLITARAVAAMLGVSQRLVYDLAQRGDLPCFRIGGAVRFSRADVDAYLLSCRIEIKPQPKTRPPTVTLRAADPEGMLRRLYAELGVKPREKPSSTGKG